MEIKNKNKTKNQDLDLDLVIIGSGAAGLTVAMGAVYLGLKVILIDKNTSIGGSSLHNSCIPSKALLHIAKIAHNINNSRELGLDARLLAVNFRKINSYIEKIKSEVAAQNDIEKFLNSGGKVILGEAKFIDKNTIAVNNILLKSKYFVIATGSRPFIPNILGLSEAGFITHETIAEQIVLPRKLIILGGTANSIEYAQAFSRLGSDVVVLERKEQILSKEDPELACQLQLYLEQEGVKFYLNTTVTEVLWKNKEKIIICHDNKGKDFSIKGQEILVGLGRKPNIRGLGLENTGIDYFADGILVDGYLRTCQKHIFALGDVAKSFYKMSHVAEAQANVLLCNISSYLSRSMSYVKIPYVIFTDPELAQIGITEQQAKHDKLSNIDILRFDFKDLDAAICRGETKGKVKLIVRKKQIIGATILGANAGEIIAEIALAMETKASIEDLAATMHAYPTLSQINRRIANKFLIQKKSGLSRSNTKKSSANADAS